MNDILTEEAKSFKLLRPKLRNGQLKPTVTYTKKLMETLYIGLGKTQDELLKGLNFLFGPKGAAKSFKRYYYPKRFIWNSTLYVKPRVMQKIDDKMKLVGIRKNLPDFNGVSKNRIIDKRNCIVDFTDIFSLVVPEENSVMTKSAIIDYIEQIWPEVLCYTLFKNDKHDSKNDIETNESLNITKDDIQHFSNEDAELETEFNEMSDEEWNNLLDILNRSYESFIEKVMAKTQIFSLSGPAIGLSQLGFDKFIISIPYTLG